MLLEFNKSVPIFTQLAEGLEDCILQGLYKEEDQIPSTTELSLTYQINPATALKGVNLLVDAGIVYKKRGLGMFVAKGAKAKILDKRKDAFFKAYVRTLLIEAEKLGITGEELIAMIKEAME